jgi:chemotaxis protein methyltransferase CheR
MRDDDCVAFLQWALPRLRLRWAGFRKVRGQVCKRIGKRMRALGVSDAGAYARYLQAHPQEWSVVDSLARVTISRFYRDRAVFDYLGQAAMPRLAAHARRQGRAELRCWSAGCASGEEAYTVVLVWQFGADQDARRLRVLATDSDSGLLDRARAGCYGASSLAELPEGWRERAFASAGDGYCLQPTYRSAVEFLRHDIRVDPPRGRFDLILCRNLAFTYFNDELQAEILSRLARVLYPQGILLLGSHETVPASAPGFVAMGGPRGFYQYRPQ